MNITNVKIELLENSSSNCKALCSITLNDSLVVTGIRIVSRKNDNTLFLAMPSRKAKDEKYYDIVYPCNKEARSALEEVILAKYNEEIAKQN